MKICVKYILNVCNHYQDDLPGQAILDLVFLRLNLLETNYFGCRYLDGEQQTVLNYFFEIIINKKIM